MSSVTEPKGNLTGWSPYVKVYDPLKAGSIDGTDLIPHDNAIVRAMSAEYNPPDERTITSNPVLTLFVGRLNLRTSERQLKDEFSQYGQVKSCRLVRDIITGMSRGYGFVEFRKESDAHRAWKAAHGSIFHERQILVEWEFSRTMPGWIPRRLGGGLGGKKESGQLRFGGRDRPFKKPLILPVGQESSAFSADHEQYSQVQESSGDSREEHSRSKYLRQDKSRFRSEFVKDPRNVYDDKREYKNYSDKKFSGDRKYKDYSDERFKYDDKKYKDRSTNQSYFPEERRRYKSDGTNKVYEHLYHEEGRQKYRHKEEDDYHHEYYQAYQDDERKFKRRNENYNDYIVRKNERGTSENISYGAENTKYKRNADDRYSEQHNHKHTSGREFREEYDSYSSYYECETETNERHTYKKYEKVEYNDFDNYYSHKSSGSHVSSKYSGEKFERKERYLSNDLSVGAGSSKSKVSSNGRLDSNEAKEINFKRKHRSSSLSSSSSSSSKSSPKRKHKKKHKKRSKHTDSSDNEKSACDSKISKKGKKSKKKKRKKSRRVSKDDSGTE